MDVNEGCLVLENGMVFRGNRFGAKRDVTAEIVFATGMNGYLETLTDPSYYGQAVVQTFPLIGNYGVIPADFESRKAFLSAYIVSEMCDAPSNFRCKGQLADWLAEQDVPVLTGVDTRTLTRVLRDHGTMNGMICSSQEFANIAQIREYRVTNAVSNTTCTEPYTVGGEDAPYHVVLLDFGAKANIARSLAERGCRVTVVPAGTKYENIAALRPDGIMLSNGAGDPADNPVALANGIPTAKLKFGHRGANQPVLNLETKRMAVTTQNHGYQVQYDPKNAHCTENADLLYINLNDNTCEGLRYKKIPAISVQFHPEACAGPQDTAFIFDEFVQMMEVQKCR